ncbi:MAG: type II toxin-antitoxin system HicB family antitoxin [Candidatus Sericytochromatia bacterium]|nr:type II toxin-antitoxin system HicB family antitoxin [Candidatus Sericytochromatia bacterium]
MQVERCEEGGFYGKIPSIDGCYTQAETLEELKDNILEVLDLYIEDELIKG